MKYFFFIVTLWTIVGWGCTTPNGEQSAYRKHISGQQLDYVITYQSLQQQVERARTRLNAQEVRQQFAGHRYISLQLKPHDGKPLEKSLASNTLNELQFHSKDKFYLASTTDTLPCRLYHVIPSTLPQRGMEIVLVFSDPESGLSDASANDLTFVFEDDLISNRTISATFSAADLSRLPAISI